MTIEEKAKAYDEAKARMSKACDEHRCSLYFMSEIFPEPKVPMDNDMKLTIIQFLEYASSYGCPDILSKEKAKTWIAWLEGKNGVDNVPLEGSVNTVATDSKQTKPNHRKPKFNEGEWIIDIQDGEILHINKVLEHAYEVTNLKGDSYEASRCSIETWNRLWTLKDARDGDILMANAPFIFNGNLEGGIGCPGAHCAINTLGKFQIPNSPRHWTSHTTTPATKEQRDLLFQKMKEAGYEWDDEKKEPKKIESKPSWSNVDEYTLNETIQHLEELIRIDKTKHCGVDVQYYQRDIDWLKSLKDRVQPQWKPNDGQLNALDKVYKTHRADSVLS